MRTYDVSEVRRWLDAVEIMSYDEDFEDYGGSRLTHAEASILDEEGWPLYLARRYGNGERESDILDNQLELSPEAEAEFLAKCEAHGITKEIIDTVLAWCKE